MNISDFKSVDYSMEDVIQIEESYTWKWLDFPEQQQFRDKKEKEDFEKWKEEKRIEDEKNKPLTEEELEKQKIEDEIPEVEKKIIVKMGDIFQLWEHRLMCWDSINIDDIEKLMDWEKADMVFTDPPYNINFKDIKGRKIQNDNLWEDFNNFINNIITNCVISIEKWYIYLCFSQRFIKDYLQAMQNNLINDYDLIIWYKDTTMRMWKDYRNYYEPIWLFRINEPIFYWKREFEKNIWEISSIHSAWSKDDKWNSWFQWWMKNLTLHPTQKPVKVPEKAINNSSEELWKILDLFWWSWSTLIASEKTNRKCYMMELDPKYIQTIIYRYHQYTWWSKKIECLSRKLDLTDILED